MQNVVYAVSLATGRDFVATAVDSVWSTREAATARADRLNAMCAGRAEYDVLEWRLDEDPGDRENVLN